MSAPSDPLTVPARLPSRRVRASWLGLGSSRPVVAGFALAVALAGCAGGPRSSPEEAASPPPDGSSLVLFLQRDGSEDALAIEDAVLPTLERIAGEFGARLEVIDARDGAPPEVVATPLLVHQNHLGRSTYVGRFTTPDRIRSFVRTVRRIPQSGEPRAREGVAVRRSGRARIAAPMKITPLGGYPLRSHDEASFVAAARAAITRGLDGYSEAPRVELGRGDRSVYIDVHPYISEEGTLYLSGAAFSPFHCHEPRWSFGGESLSGPWSAREALFEEAGRRFSEQIDWILRERGGEDVYRPLATATPVKSWEALGLPLPPAPPDAPPAVGVGALPRAWRLDPTNDRASTPPVAFRFPAPLDNYSGGAEEVTGRLTLDDGDRLSGEFRVETASVTMGEPDLDGYIHGASVLRVGDHPEARFTIIEGAAIGGVEWGRGTPITARGRFILRDESVEVGATGSLTPDLDLDGEPRLRLEATFRVPIGSAYNLRGPDGPDAARDWLIFNIEADLRPASSP